MTQHIDQKMLTGAGGGGKQKKQPTPIEQPNTLRSKSTIRVLDLIGEGEIVGLVNGHKSIFVNETQLQADDGSYNFQGITVDERVGTPWQPHVQGMPHVEAEQYVGQEVPFSFPVTASLSDPSHTAVRVTVRLPALFDQPEAGNPWSDYYTMQATNVRFSIHIRRKNGTWQTYPQEIHGKCTAPYDRQFYFTLPANPLNDGWDIKITRDMEDASRAGLQNTVVFAAVTGLTERLFNYPYSAYYGITVDAEQFGDRIPSRGYLVRGRIIQVPVNYDPETRSYSGIWNGLFKWAYSSNPAWVLYDLFTNDRFGLGEFIDPAAIDKWSLYAIAQYCDELVPNGYGGFEPRFTFNGVLSTQREAYEVIQALATAFRGMAYWTSGAITASQDRPADPVLLVTEANVIGGRFNYTSSALKARHTVIQVQWNDPNDLYRLATEVVEEPDGILRYGYRPDETTAVGCTSRGQAHRFGKWSMFADLYETQMVTYRAGLDHAFLRPGDIIALQDPNIAGADFGGRVIAGTDTVISLDQDIASQWVAGTSYALTVRFPDGTIHERAIIGIVGKDVTLVSPLPAAPDAGCLWIIAASTVKPQLFRVLSLREVEPHIFEIVALTHETGKYDFVERDIKFDPQPVSMIPTGPVKPVPLVDVTERLYKDNNKVKTQVTLSWSPSPDPRVVGYAIEYREAVQGVPFTRADTTSSTAHAIPDFPTGTFEFRIVCITLTGAAPSTSTTYTVLGKTLPPANVENLRALSTVNGVQLVWDEVLDLDLIGYEIRRGEAWDTAEVIAQRHISTTLFVPHDTADIYTYLVRSIDELGIYSTATAMCQGQVSAPDSVPDFRAIPQGDHVQFRWQIVPGQDVEYEIRSGDGWFIASFVGRSAGDNLTVLWPANGPITFWIKARSKLGLYSPVARLARATLAVPSDRNIVVEVNGKELVWPGIKHNMEVMPEQDNLLVMKPYSAASGGEWNGAFFMPVEIDREYRSRSWAQLYYGALSEDGITWDDATFTWDDPAAKQTWFPSEDAEHIDVATKIAIPVAPLIEDIDGVLFNQADLRTRRGHLPVESVNAALAPAWWTDGVFVTQTTYLTYSHVVPSQFTLMHRFILKEGDLGDMVFYTLWFTEGSQFIRVGRRANGDIYWSDHLGQLGVLAGVVAPTDDLLTIVLSQNASQRTIYATSELAKYSGSAVSVVAPPPEPGFDRLSLYAAK